MGKRRIISLHWDNMDSQIVSAQAAVFRHLGLSIEQHCRDRLDHGAFLDEIMENLERDTSVLIVDIDCVPLNREIVERAFAFAESGGIIGCAQVSRHIDSMRIFTAPMFLAISQQTWEELGRPSFRTSPTGDIAQDLHDVAVKMNRKIEYLYPTYSLIPKWRMADRGYYGIGTFHQGGVFHLFQSRARKYNWMFLSVCDDVVHDRSPNLAELSRRAIMTHPLAAIRGHLREAQHFVRRSAKAAVGRMMGRPTAGQAPERLQG